jgi:hypothetical protein
MTPSTWTRRIGCAAAASLLAFAGGLDDTLAPSPEHPAIGYAHGATHDPAAELNLRLANGSAGIKFSGIPGHLASVLEALDVPVESQIVVYSKTSRQLPLIEPRNPRAIFFNDSVSVGLMRGGVIEVASVDPRQGVVLYTLAQKPVARPRFERDDTCLMCHRSDITLGVPGMMVKSVLTGVDGSPRLLYGSYETDHRSPLEERWGGWYVTGSSGGAKHLGNMLFRPGDSPEELTARPAIQLASLDGQFDTGGYLSPFSDIAALMVFNHQMRMTNLLIRLGWETRVAVHDKRPLAAIDAAAREVVDYLLFVDEAPLRSKVSGSSGFTQKFAQRGPRDKHGRSLRDLDLVRRLMKYPCSYMLYSDLFDALPAAAKDAVYRRLWQVLSGEERSGKYAHLTLADRRAVVEILRDTKKDLPAYFLPWGGPLVHAGRPRPARAGRGSAADQGSALHARLVH